MGQYWNFAAKLPDQCHYLYFSTVVSVGKLEEIEGRKFYDNVGARLADGLIRVIDAVQARIAKDKEVNVIKLFL